MQGFHEGRAAVKRLLKSDKQLSVNTVN
jgi:hypothetical protein